MLTPRPLLLLAALSFIPTLFFYMVGEEGIYTISTLEMWASHDWMTQTLYGINLLRPPMMNWLALPIANLLGWSHILIAIRLLSVLATLGTAAWLYWLCRKLFEDRSFALFASLSYLCLMDLQLYRGWLSYTDPLFAFFTFGAMVALWIACLERHRGWLLLSVAMVSCALLTKAFTAYVFYGTVFFVLVCQRSTRNFLLSPVTLLILCATLITPYAWFYALPHQGGQSSSMMLNEILIKLAAQDGWGYLQRLLTYPLENAFWLSPVTLLASYLLLRKRVWQPECEITHFQSALLITGLAILPYWLAPQGGIRYLLPVYPMVALICARYIWRAGEQARKMTLRWFAVVIGFKFLFALVLFPYYQHSYRGENYVTTAHIIAKRTTGYPLYGKDFRSTGENIIGQIDIDRLPLLPVQQAPENWDNGFWLGPDADEKIGRVVEKYVVAKDEFYLLCRGAACLSSPQR
jgi:4-amino-4-deoxy-L-arabinose transferase-like glycosyltransferase